MGFRPELYPNDPGILGAQRPENRNTKLNRIARQTCGLSVGASTFRLLNRPICGQWTSALVHCRASLLPLF